MGGGGGGGINTLGDIRSLEEKAKEALKRGQEGKKNVFISFVAEDLDEVNLLRASAANEKNDIEFKDYSVKEPYDSERADYIKQKLRERINQASTTVVYLSNNTPPSKWVEWEVDKSVELGKRVIAIHAGAKPPSKLPNWVKEHGIKVVPWSKLPNELSSK